jgi:hypothetical protein
VFTDEDLRLGGEHAMIGPPYATAEWAAEDKGWMINFNQECSVNRGNPGDKAN